MPIDELPLPDISFDILPYWPQGIYLVEGYMTTLMVMVILLFIFHRNGYRIAQRYCVISGVVYLLRAVCMSVTSISMSDHREWCAIKMTSNSTTFDFITTIVQRSIIYIPTLGSQSMMKEFFCGDYIYSGHTINIVMGQ